MALIHRVDGAAPLLTVAEYNAYREALPGKFTEVIKHTMQMAMKDGLPAEDVSQIMLHEAADLMRFLWGDRYLDTMAGQVMSRAGKPIVGGA